MKLTSVLLICLNLLSCTTSPPAETKKAEPSLPPPPPALIVESVEAKISKPLIQSEAPAVYHLRGGKLVGPRAFGRTKVLSRIKNKKGSGYTTETCYEYRDFSIVELRSEDEIGSAELSLRKRSKPNDHLCSTDFSGPLENLKIIEGSFAGVGGDLILVDGIDSNEGQIQFQIFSTQTGREIFKSFRHPKQDLSMIGTTHGTALEFFAKMNTKCELVSEGESCWRKILQDNHILKLARPDCASLSEPTMVFAQARVELVGSTPIKFTGKGKAICASAP